MKTRLLFSLAAFCTLLCFSAAGSYAAAARTIGSNNANLKSITVSTGSILVTSSGPAAVNYVTSVSQATTSLMVTPVTSDSGATVKVNGTTVTSGAASSPIALNASGTTTINMLVTAANGTTTKTYSITVSKNGSNNANAKFVLNPASILVAASGASNVNYTTSVSAATTSLTVTPTTTDANATVTVNSTPVASGTASAPIALNASGTTIVNMLVTAEDGVTTKSYSITVSKNGSNNANAKFVLSPASILVAASGASNVNYTTTVNAATTSLTVTPTTTDANAAVTVNGTPVASGTASGPVALNASGTTIVNMLVTAEDGVTTKTYSITISKNGSNNANAKFVLNPASILVAASGASNVNYTTTVSAATTSLTVTPTTTDANATVTVNGTPVASGTASGPVALNASGTTIVNMLVTAEDGVTTKTYSITISKNGSNNANLKYVTLSTGSTLTRISGPSDINYYASVSLATTLLTVTPVTTDAKATVTVNGQPVVSGSASQAISIASSPTVINLLVTAEDGVTTKSISITVYKNGSSDATLKNVTLSSGSTLTRVSGSSNINYTASVVSSTVSITVTPTTNDANATVTVNGLAVTSGSASQAISLTSNPTVINLLVTAEDGITTKSISITVSKNGSSNASLKKLTVSTGSVLSVISGSSNVNYAASVAPSTASLSVTATASDANASITVNGQPVTSGSASQVISLSANPTVINLLVTAQDGITTKSYSITVFKNSGTSTTYTWTGAGSDSKWTNFNNWSPSTGYPVAGDDVLIGAGTGTPTVDKPSACASITITGATSINLLAALNVSGTITLNSSLAMTATTSGNCTAGGLTVNASAGLANSGTFTVKNGNVLMGSGAYISNLGNFSISGTAVRMGSSGYINNNAGGIFTIDNNSSIDFLTNAASGSYIQNSGTFYAGTSNSGCTVNLNYAGVYLQNSGTFYLGSTSVINLTGASTSLQNTGSFTLQSDANGSAAIGNISGASAACTGSYNVERFITGGSGVYRGYRLLTSPVSAATVNGNRVYSLNFVKSSSYITGTTGTAGGFDNAGSGNPSLYLYRENIAASNASFTSGNYRGINDITSAPSYSIDGDGSGFNIPAGNGFLFFFRGDRSAASFSSETSTAYVPTNTTLTSAGTLNQGQVIVKEWYTPGSSNLGDTNTPGNPTPGFNLVGNPYPSSIDWDTYNSSSPASGIYAPSTTPFMYILDPVSKNYSAYQKGTGGVGTIATANANIIPSGQAFFIVATDPSAQLIFNESAKVNAQANAPNGNLFMGAPAQAAVTQYLRLQLAKDSINTDDTYIGFSSGFSSQYVIDEDAVYLPGHGEVSLCSVSSDKIPCAIDKLPLPKQQGETLGLIVNAASDGTYSLNMTQMVAIPRIYEVWLIDAYKKDSLDMRVNKRYGFDLSKADTNSFGSKRFSLVIRQNPALGIHLLNFTATKATGGSQIVWTTENEENYTNFTIERSIDGGITFNILGGMASSGLGTYNFMDNDPSLSAANQYRLKIEDLNGTISYSNVVTLSYGNAAVATASNNISVYPNPASGIINLAINKSYNAAPLKTNGVALTLANSQTSYGIKIINITGAVIKTASSATPSWKDDIGNLSPGTYIIQVTNNIDHSLVGKSTFVKL